MDADLAPVVADLSNDELERLIAANYGVPQTAPGLLAWIDGASEWKLNRRGGLDYPLLPPEAAINRSEDEVSIRRAIATA